jgi:hypothetical protein
VRYSDCARYTYPRIAPCSFQPAAACRPNSTSLDRGGCTFGSRSAARRLLPAGDVNARPPLISGLFPDQQVAAPGLAANRAFTIDETSARAPLRCAHASVTVDRSCAIVSAYDLTSQPWTASRETKKSMPGDSVIPPTSVAHCSVAPAAGLRRLIAVSLISGDIDQAGQGGLSTANRFSGRNTQPKRAALLLDGTPLASISGQQPVTPTGIRLSISAKGYHLLHQGCSLQPPGPHSLRDQTATFQLTCS